MILVHVNTPLVIMLTIPKHLPAEHLELGSCVVASLLFAAMQKKKSLKM